MCSSDLSWRCFFVSRPPAQVRAGRGGDPASGPGPRPAVGPTRIGDPAIRAAVPFSLPRVAHPALPTSRSVPGHRHAAGSGPIPKGGDVTRSRDRRVTADTGGRGRELGSRDSARGPPRVTRLGHPRRGEVVRLLSPPKQAKTYPLATCLAGTRWSSTTLHCRRQAPHAGRARAPAAGGGQAINKSSCHTTQTRGARAGRPEAPLTVVSAT